MILKNIMKINDAQLAKKFFEKKIKKKPMLLY